MSETQQHSERAHALLSASGSARWMNCTASARLEESMNIKDESSVFALEGTLAHELGEQGLLYLAKKIDKDTFIANIKALKQHELFHPEMTGYVEQYCNYVSETLHASGPDAVLLVEERVDLTDYVPESFGSCDSIIVADGTMNVIDLKYGKGLRVEADNNSQLMLYALGAVAKYSLAFDIEHVVMTIHQPRLDHISTFEMSVEDLLKWGDEVVKPKANKAFSGEGDTCEGSWCRWCKASVRCHNLKDKIDSVPTAKHPNELSDSEVLEMLETKKALEGFFNKLNKYVIDEALDGKEWEGYKVVEGVSRRKWIPEEELVKVLRRKKLSKKDFFVNKLDTITNVQKRIGVVDDTLVVRSTGSPTFVKLSDKRPAINIPSAVDELLD